MKGFLPILATFFIAQISFAQSEPNLGPAGGVSCATATPIGCGVSHLVASSGQGQFSAVVPCPESQVTPGQESYFLFTPFATGVYTLNVTPLTFALSGEFRYYFRENLTNLECDGANWKCIGSTNSPANFTFGPLEAGKSYLILTDCSITTTLRHSIRITGCELPNDFPAGAIDLSANGACSSPYTNLQGTKDLNEPDPDIDTTDGYAGRWLATINRTVWFKFTAPASGTVTVSTQAFEAGKICDTRIAMYKVGNVADYSTYRLLESDDNETSPIGINFNTLNASIPYTGLTPGTVYYLQVDATVGASDLETPYFCISVKNCVRRSNLGNCAAGYNQKKVNGKLPDGDRWYGIYTQPATGDLGEIVAAVWPNKQNLDTVFCRMRVFNTIQSNNIGIKYMPAYFRFNAKNIDTLAVKVRLFYTKSEFDSLKKYANLPLANIGDLNVSNFKGNVEDCSPNNNFTGTSRFIKDVDTLTLACENTFMLSFQNNQLGEFVAHFGNVSLPVELRVFKGAVLPKSNRLTWETSLEKDVVSYIVQRSANGFAWENIATVASKGDSERGNSYTFDDQSPLARNFYRLQIVEADAEASPNYSSIVNLSRSGMLFGIEAAYPNPVADQLNIQFNALSEGAVWAQVTDLTGRVVAQQQVAANEGTNQLALQVGQLGAGVYFVTVVTDGNASVPVRFVKY
jgi:hypothetical protein